MRQLARALGPVLTGLVLIASLHLVAPPPAAQAQTGPCAPHYAQPTGSPVSVGTQPFAVEVADFDGDGQADLVVANSLSNNVSILLGDGSGGFTRELGSPIPVGAGPNAVAVADFNGDGRPDLAVTSFLADTVTTFLRQPGGGFVQEGAALPVGDGPVSVAVGDFNGDARPDLVVALFNADNVSILLRQAGGGFAPEGTGPYAVGTRPSAVAVGSFNGDTRPDLAVTNSQSGTVTILLRNASIGFTQATGSPITVGANPSDVVVGSFNGDANVDLAVANNGSDNVTILLGSGNGGFAQAGGSPITVGDGPIALAIGDLNNDSHADLAVANNGSDNVTILLANGNGGFSQPAGSPVAAGDTPRAVAVGSFNGDSKLDLAVANVDPGKVTILVNDCPPLADVSISVEDAPDPVDVGANLAYTITVRNAGPDPSSFVKATTTLPADLVYVSSTTVSKPPQSFGVCVVEPPAHRWTCTLSPMPVGSATYRLVVRPTAPGTVSTTFTVSSESGGDNAVNNSATVTTTVPRCAPRPRVTVAAARAGANLLKVTIASSTPPSALGNHLIQLSATVPPNARLDVPNGPGNLTGQQTVPVGDGTQPVVFFLRRVGSGAVTVPLVVTDTCGDWKTFVGGGNGAF